MSAPFPSPRPAEPPPDVTDEWRDAHLATVFARWHDAVATLQAASIAAVIAAAGVRPGDRVLDVGCGSGIPTLALAAAVGPTGTVVATDPNPIFLAAVAANARQRGLANLAVVQASAATLPGPDGAFDAATCHMGAMFFPNLLAGLRRIRTVLRPGARAGFVAWGPEADNAFFRAFWGAAGPHLPPAPSAPRTAADPDRPWPMRFARPGSLRAALRAAGFGDVQEAAHAMMLAWPEGPDALRQFWYELSGAAERVPAADRAGLDTDVLAAFQRFAADDGLRFPATIVVASGQA